MTLANPTKAGVIEAIKGLDADDEMTEVIVAALEKLIPDASAPTGRRPLVITEVGGGLVQNTIRRPGEGEPRIHVLDYDREGQGGDELRDFAEEIRAARDDLAEFGGPEAADAIAEFNRMIAEYNDLADRGETASRYR